MVMRSLITGCQGFIGKNLAQHLKKQGHHVTGIDKKLKVGDPVFVDEIVGHDMESRITIENDFDRVYHLSADVPNSKNVGSEERVKEVIKAAKNNNCAIRIGVNAGSLEKHLLEKLAKSVERSCS